MMRGQEQTPFNLIIPEASIGSMVFKSLEFRTTSSLRTVEVDDFHAVVCLGVLGGWPFC